MKPRKRNQTVVNQQPGWAIPRKSSTYVNTETKAENRSLPKKQDGETNAHGLQALILGSGVC